MAQEKPKKKDYIILKAIVFPYINLLWGGCIIMIIGTVIAIFNRIQQSKKGSAS
jgi:cytochrome c-type biogenesis protein CcmF